MSWFHQNLNPGPLASLQNTLLVHQREIVFFRIVLYISNGDRFVHFFFLRLFYHSNLDSCIEELMIDYSVLFMVDASIQYSLLITKSLILPGIKLGSPD